MVQSQILNINVANCSTVSYGVTWCQLTLTVVITKHQFKQTNTWSTLYNINRLIH